MIYAIHIVAHIVYQFLRAQELQLLFLYYGAHECVELKITTVDSFNSPSSWIVNRLYRLITQLT